MKMIRAALRGVIIGVAAGIIAGQVWYLKNRQEKNADFTFSSGDMENNGTGISDAVDTSGLTGISDDSDISALTGISDILQLSGISDAAYISEIEGISEETMSGTASGNTSSENAASGGTASVKSNRTAIRFDAVYEGAEKLSEKETRELVTMVKQAVLYGLTEKYGEDYNYNMEPDDARFALILSLPDIESMACEACEEYGVEAEVKALFTVKYMDEEELNGRTYEAGNYETLEIIIK